VDRSFLGTWEQLRSSGILDRLVASGDLIPYAEESLDLAADPTRAIAVIQPEPVDFVSYPYEWSFGQLRDAALLTLAIQERAVREGFRLRDATAYNVQFHGGRPVLIDTLSLEAASPTDPWPAYRQFCQHFLAPLALMAYRDVRCGLMLREFTDGIPVDLAATILPGRTRLSVGLGAHIHVHARAQRPGRRTGRATATHRPRLSRSGAAAVLDSLRRTVTGLRWHPEGTPWARYDESASYAHDAIGAKERIVRGMLERAGGSVVWDLGANVGHYSRIAASLGRRVVAWDVDHGATERHYRAIRSAHETHVLPLVGDLTNPSPSLGWAHAERRSMADRAEADAVLALALIHHVAIGANVPLDHIAEFLARLAPNLIIEFVPRSDPMVAGLLASREDVFHDYSQAGFLAAFERHFRVLESESVPSSERVLHRMERHG
jgi:hypothetical protein